MTATALSRSDLDGDVVVVAPTLLGCLVVAGPVVARIVEVEAYGPDDPASHSHGGPTQRSAPMFEAPGTAYVYLSYGVHWCLNVAVGPAGVGAAVLLRAAAVVQGEQVVRQRRGSGVATHALLRGPGNLGRGLGVDGGLSGLDLLAGDPRLWLGRDEDEVGTIANGPRVGIRLAADRPWRWWMEGRPEVSAYRRHPSAVTPS